MNRSEIEARIRTLGRTFDDKLRADMYEIFVPLQRALPQNGAMVQSDIAYGSHARQKLDIYRPAQPASGPMPTVMFVPGGGFTGGDKNIAPGVIHGNIGRFLARHGIVTVIPSYRLAPEAAWPEGARDVAAAHRWVIEHAGSLGGDPARIVLFGHSAGASHVATCVFHPEFRTSGGPGCVGAVLASGRYLLPSTGALANLAAYYGDDPKLYPARQVVGNVVGADLPTFVTVAELDPTVFAHDSLKLVTELTEKAGRMPRFKQVRGHNHISETVHLGLDDEPFGLDLLDFIFTLR